MGLMRRKSLIEIESYFPDCDDIWRPTDLLRTERVIRSRLPMGENSSDAESIVALLQAVRLSCLKNQLNEAKNFLAYAEQLLPGLDPSDKLKLEIRYKLEEGRYYSFTMNPSRALEAFRSGWESSKNIGKLDFFAVDAAYMISITLPVKQGREWLYLGLSLAEKSTNALTKEWLAYLYLAVGWDYFDRYDFNSALDFFSKIRDECAANQSLTRMVSWSKARVLRALKKIDTAIDAQREILIDDGGLPLEENGFVYLELAELYVGLQQWAKAKDYYVLAFESLKLNKLYSENYDYELCEIEKKSRKKMYHS